MNAQYSLTLHGLKKSLLVMGAFLSIGIVYYTLSGYGSLSYLQEHQALLKKYTVTHPLYASCIYVIMIAVSTLCALPATMIITILGGYLFGTVYATLYTALGATCGSTLGCALMRHSIGKKIQRRYAENITHFNDHIERHGQRYLIALRLAPIVPFFLVTILSSCTRIPLTTFAYSTFFGSIPVLFLYAYLGNHFTKVTTVHDFFTIPILATLALLTLCAMVSLLYPHSKQ